MIQLYESQVSSVVQFCTFLCPRAAVNDKRDNAILLVFRNIFGPCRIINVCIKCGKLWSREH